jgi:hypothetical protein
MRSTPRRWKLGAWFAALVAAAGCAQGSTLPTGSGGSGGADTTTSGTTSSATTTSSTTTSATTTSSTTSSTTTSATTTSSTTTGGGCVWPQHLCGGTCAGNTIDTGCSASTTCDPCPTPTHGTAVCATQGTCDLKCDTGYQANATKTDCEAIPPPPECCNDSECPFATICLDGYCRSPFASACDPARCNVFCQCTTGGTPQSTGMCNLNVIVWECLCSP